MKPYPNSLQMSWCHESLVAMKRLSSMRSPSEGCHRWPTFKVMQCSGIAHLSSTSTLLVFLDLQVFPNAPNNTFVDSELFSYTCENTLGFTLDTKIELRQRITRQHFCNNKY
ncbi:hypothetical protein TNCV_2950021 [Trichonephila clavipes]|nr:hypothetical protein TNCV_2950021 [Trichonephila clavipes]